MIAPIIESDAPVTLVGGAGAAAQDLDWALGVAPRLVAADGGARVALAAGRVPEAVIGDLDSIAPGDRARLPAAAVHRVAEQDSTDFDKCLARIAAPLVLGLGFLGARLDHTLAALSALVRHDGACLLVGGEDVAFHVARHVALDLPPGSRLSIFPMAPVTGRSRGLEWPIDGLVLAPAGRIGTSNRATGPVEIDFDGPGAVVIVPLAARDAALAGLGWRAHGGGGRRSPFSSSAR